MAKKRAGWERMIYYDAAGATATTAISANVTDIDVQGAHEFNEHTTRGDGSALPKVTEQIVALKAGVVFKMIYKDADANMVALLAASRTGVGKAIKVVRMSGGETEFDGDCYLEDDSPGPLKGGMEVTFTCHPTDDYARAWTVG